MCLIEEIAFTINQTKCVFKLYKYQEQTVKKIGKPIEPKENEPISDYQIVDAKVYVDKYAIHQEYTKKDIFSDTIICETESYNTVLTIFKDILEQYLQIIKKNQKL